MRWFSIVNYVLLILMFNFWGCKGKPVAPDAERKSVEAEIPAEWAKAFEVHEGFPTLDISSEMLVPPKLLQGSIDEKKKKSSKQVKASGAAPTSTPAPSPTKKSYVAIVDGLKIPDRRPPVDPIWVGESVKMDVTWLTAQAGEFDLEVLPYKTMKGRKVYNFRGTARTSKLFSVFYKAEDWVQTFVDFDGWFPYKFVLHGDESKHVRDTIELFDHAAGKQYVHARDDRLQDGVHEEKKVSDLTRFSQDSLSALYYLRTQKFDVGQTVKFPMTTGGDQWDMEVIVLNRETISTGMGDRPALKAKVETRFKGALKQAGDAFFWLSDDDKKYPLKFEAKVKIGWVSGVAKQINPGSPN